MEERLPGVTTWIVRFGDRDQPPVEGRLQVDEDVVRFRAGTKGTASAVTIPRTDVVRAELVVDGLAESVVLTLADGRQVVIDHGVLPAGDLARVLRPPPFLEETP